MIDTETALRGLVLESDWELRQKVVKDIIKAWDEGEKEGDFCSYLLNAFCSFWMQRVRRN